MFVGWPVFAPEVVNCKSNQTAVDRARPVVVAVSVNGCVRTLVTAFVTSVRLITVPVAEALLAGALPVLSAILIETVVAVLLLTRSPVMMNTTRPVDVGVIVQGAAAAPRPII